MPTPFSLNAIKGRVAETIVQELFLAHEFNVFHYGMERSVSGIAQVTLKTYGSVKQQIPRIKPGTGSPCPITWCRTRRITGCISWM